MANSHKVKIAARLRPSIKGELLDEGVRVEPGDDGPSCVCVTNPRDNSQVFRFPIASCYDHTSTQEDIFHNDVEPLINVVYGGVTVTIFAYGVTSSGKTHTMQGTKIDPGVIPRVVRALFERRTSIEQRETSISVSYMEIYKDEVYDLMVDRDNAQKLPVRENDAGQVFVANLNSTPIESAEEFEKLYSMANKQRSVGATLLNRASSRSHAIVTIEVKMVHQAENKIITGKINLVDLAGSENNKLTGNDPSRMAESAAINKSLSVLGQVVHALNQGAPRIPYRNSKLTRILQDALGGASVGLLICNLAPGSKFRQDTLNTLNFAVRTKNIENKPVINERDNRPAPKPHFAAIQAPIPASKPASLPIQTVAGPSRPSIVSSRNAGSLPGLAGPSRVPRVSAIGGSAPYPGASKRRESRIGTVHSHRDSQGLNLSEKEIDDRISKAVEAEVARRLEERLKEEEERRVRERAEAEPKQQESPQLPSGLLTPLLKRHQDLDNELRKRLQDLESKYERGNKELTLKEGLSPVSRKKTGRAYVALARAHSEKGDLQNALDLYRRAEAYVPDNVKLKERIIEIEWAVKNGTEFQPSPKRPRKAKSKKSRSRKAKGDSNRGSENTGSQGAASVNPADSDDDDTVENLLEVTNSPRKLGRSGNAHESGDDAATTPKKPRNRKKRAADSDDEWAPSAPTKKGKAAANIRSGA
ncbi:kinesin-domain-containing protein [Dentipellis sp. KUC8613]|nr:kinesin-domain-containing protein [Dentipellis sp. KUC8613]